MKSQMNTHQPFVAAVVLPGDVREQGASQRGLRRAPTFFHASQFAAREAIGGLFRFGP